MFGVQSAAWLPLCGPRWGWGREGVSPHGPGGLPGPRAFLTCRLGILRRALAGEGCAPSAYVRAVRMPPACRYKSVWVPTLFGIVGGCACLHRNPHYRVQQRIGRAILMAGQVAA